MKQALILSCVFLGVCCATLIARAEDTVVPAYGYKAPPFRRVPDAVIPRGYDYSTPPSQLIDQPVQSNCIETTYGYRCISF